MAKKKNLTGRQEAKLAKLLAGFAGGEDAGNDLMNKLKEEQLYTEEDRTYQLTSCLNFYKARVEPFIRKDEFPLDFDKRYREWKIRTCEACEEDFAYAYAYEGIKTCSLECAEELLKKIGITFSRHHDLKRRWGHFYHPAIVPASALAEMKVLYADLVPNSFDPSSLDLPTNLMHLLQEHVSDSVKEQDNQHNSNVQIA